MPQLSHGHDGLIFSPAKEPYTPGQCFSVLKWKPSDLNSVDFRLKVTKTCRYGELPETHGQLYVGGYEMPFSIMKPLNKEMRQLDGKIVECMWNPARQQWVFMRVRDDKTFPNNWKTAKGVCESIEHPVTKEKLLEIIEIKLRAADHQKIAGQQPHHLMLPGKASPSSSHSNTADSLLMPPPKIPRTK
jgi:mRNA-capping enzyme